jgi:pyridoxal phosphate-dependent aminotransferase EpsN
MSGKELELVREAFESNWVAPLGPHVDAFEREFIRTIMGGTPSAERRTPNAPGGADEERETRDEGRTAMHACALSSGTAALHLALRILTGDEGRETRGKGRSNEVLCSTFTFSASANAIAYEGLVPVFIDSDERSWNMDPGLLREELSACAKRGKLPRAVIVVDLYGQCADYDPISEACAEFEVPLIEDAAEALGAVYWGQTKSEVRSQKLDGKGSRDQEIKGSSGDGREAPVSSLQSAGAARNDGRRTMNVRPAGSFGAAAAFSFNGNKVITTAGGGMLVSHDKSIVDKARFLATQARDKAPYYQHSEVGFNYRMSNVLAAIGRGQLTVLEERIAARRRNFEFYRQALGDLPGFEFMPEAPFGRSTRWLTCLTIGKAKVKAKVEGDGGRRTGRGGRGAKNEGGPGSEVLRIIEALEKENIESRPLWKPMHLQPVFKGCRVRGGRVSERLFENGLCLPSGSALTEPELERICGIVRKTHQGVPKGRE